MAYLHESLNAFYPIRQLVLVDSWLLQMAKNKRQII